MRNLRLLLMFVFISGLCALVYQITWMRDFRLVFGATTAASAAVLGIFIGGLGFGGLWFGPRVDRSDNPLLYYAKLEVAIALSAAATPLLLWGVRELYLALGGTAALGVTGGTILRLLLSTAVIGVPTFLMGGTLPAIARAGETDADERRRGVALLYGVNTLGAVAGCILTTFLLLEIAGTRMTLWMGALLNLAVAAAAWNASLTFRPAAESWERAPRRSGSARSAKGAQQGIHIIDAPPPAAFVLTAAGIVGFAFFLMEIVWYRMLIPLFGGSIFTFGLILTLALLGIGLGGAAYAFAGAHRRPTLSGFSFTCLAQAVFLALPYVAGDRLALLALQLRPAGDVAFSASLLNWSLVTAIVVLPAALVAGYQFPLLIALLGRGRENVGRQVGLAYACNTFGAIIGSLAGGFGLLPWLGAEGCWLLAIGTLAVLGIASAALAGMQSGFAARRMAPAGLACLLIPAFTGTGPTAAWRHSAIGAGREMLPSYNDNDVRRWLNIKRRVTIWEKEGVESSIAMEAQSGISLIVNGKNDSNTRTDAATTIMLGLLGAILHPEAKTAAVVGLGTGMTAGWLGAVPGIERVDVVELEEAVVEVAKACAPVNHDVLNNPRVNVLIGDAREVLPASRTKYDVIVSEPSNPFRAGIATLFTREYYRSMAGRLNENGLFLQWVQAYEIDADTLSTIYATLGSVYPHVEVWQVHAADTIVVASMKPLEYDVELLRGRLEQEPYRSGLEYAWRTTGLEGLLGHFVASTPAVMEVASKAESLNTDDRTVIEFGFARSLGTRNHPDVGAMRNHARLTGADRPALRGGVVDWERVREEVALVYTSSGFPPNGVEGLAPEQQARVEAQKAFLENDADKLLAAWSRQPREPSGSLELAMVAEALAEKGDEKAVRYIDQLRASYQPEADAILGRLRLRQNRHEEAASAFESAFIAYRTNPWPLLRIMRSALTQARVLAATTTEAGPRMFAMLTQPFSTFVLNEDRYESLMRLGALVPPQDAIRYAMEPVEPNVLWQRELLEFRRDCYRAVGHPRAGQAEADLQTCLKGPPGN